MKAHEPYYIVQSVRRALKIISILSKEGALGVSELSRIVDLNKSTVFGLLRTLEYEDYVCQNKKTDKYQLTLKLFQLGSKVFEELDLRNIARPYLEKLVEIHQETAHLVVPDGVEVIYIDKVESHRSIRICSNIGKRLPMHCTGVGKALLAYEKADNIEEILRKQGLKKYTEKTITDHNVLFKELEKIRDQGYATDDEEIEEGLKCVAAPIWDINGKVIAATSVAGPAMRMTDEKIQDIVKDIVRFNKEISASMGYDN